LQRPLLKELGFFSYQQFLLVMEKELKAAENFACAEKSSNCVFEESLLSCFHWCSLASPAANSWLYTMPPYQILVLSSDIVWSLLLNKRCLSRLDMRSSSRSQTNILATFFGTTWILFYMHSPYSLL